MVFQVELKFYCELFNILFALVDDHGREDDGIRDQHNVVVFVLQHEVDQRNIQHLAAIFVHFDLVAEGELVGEHDDEAIDHVGDIVLGQEGEGCGSDAETEEQFRYPLPEKDQHGDQEKNGIQYGSDAVNAQYEVVAGQLLQAMFLQVPEDRDDPADGYQEVGPHEQRNGIGDPLQPGILLKEVVLTEAEISKSEVYYQLDNKDEYLVPELLPVICGLIGKHAAKITKKEQRVTLPGAHFIRRAGLINQ